MADRRGPETLGSTKFAGGWTSPTGKEFVQEHELYSAFGTAGRDGGRHSRWETRQDKSNHLDAFPCMTSNLDSKESETPHDFDSSFNRYINVESDHRYLDILDPYSLHTSFVNKVCVPTHLTSGYSGMSSFMDAQHYLRSIGTIFNEGGLSSSEDDIHYGEEVSTATAKPMVVHGTFPLDQSGHFGLLDDTVTGTKLNDSTVDGGYHTNSGPSSNMELTTGHDGYSNEASVNSMQSWLAPVDEPWPGLTVERASRYTKPCARPTSVTCLICFKAYASQAALRHHERSHERVHSCSQCQKSFAYKKDLLKHEVTHSTNRAFKCPELDCLYHIEGFKRNDHLIRHTKTKHPLHDRRKALNASPDSRTPSQWRPRNFDRPPTIGLSSRQCPSDAFDVARLKSPRPATLFSREDCTRSDYKPTHSTFAEDHPSKRQRVESSTTQFVRAGSDTSALSATTAPAIALGSQRASSRSKTPRSPFPPSQSRSPKPYAPGLSPAVPLRHSPQPLLEEKPGPKEENETSELRITTLLDIIRGLTVWTEEIAERINETSSFDSESDSGSDGTENTSKTTQTTKEPTDDGDGRTNDSSGAPARSSDGGSPGPSGTNQARENTSQNTSENEKHTGQPEVDTPAVRSKTLKAVIACLLTLCKGKDRDISSMLRCLRYCHSFWYCVSDDRGFSSEADRDKHKGKHNEDHSCTKSDRWSALKPPEQFERVAKSFKEVYEDEEVYTKIRYVDPELGDKPTRNHSQDEPKRRNRNSKRTIAVEQEACYKRVRKVEDELLLLHREVLQEKAKTAGLERQLYEERQLYQERLLHMERLLYEATAQVNYLEGRLQGRHDHCPSMTNDSTRSSRPAPDTPITYRADQPSRTSPQHGTTNLQIMPDNGDLVDPFGPGFSYQQQQAELNQQPVDYQRQQGPVNYQQQQHINLQQQGQFNLQQQGQFKLAGCSGVDTTTNTGTGVLDQLRNRSSSDDGGDSRQSLHDSLGAARINHVLSAMPGFSDPPATGYAQMGHGPGCLCDVCIQIPNLAPFVAQQGPKLPDSDAAHNANGGFGGSICLGSMKSGTSINGLQTVGGLCNPLAPLTYPTGCEGVDHTGIPYGHFS